jgi:hypothetical protein
LDRAGVVEVINVDVSDLLGCLVEELLVPRQVARLQ